MLENVFFKVVEKEKDVTSNRGVLIDVQNHICQRINNTFIINVHNSFLKILLPSKLKTNKDNLIFSQYVSTLAKGLMEATKPTTIAISKKIPTTNTKITPTMDFRIRKILINGNKKLIIQFLPSISILFSRNNNWIKIRKY